MRCRLFAIGAFALAAGLLAGPSLAADDATDPQEYYEVRSYILGSGGDASAIDRYLRDALIPALQRRGIGPVGAFSNAQQDESGSERTVLVIPYGSPNEMAEIWRAIESDPQYRADAKEYLSRGADERAYERIESELLAAMQCMPQLNVPEGTLDNASRVYELRTYESANERLGNLKVDMFNNGEVPIFLDSGIQPIFIGESLIGPYLPSLTYLTVYDDDAARTQAWQAFREHPDWKVLSKKPKYQDTVSGIHKYVLTPKPYSQM